MRKKNADAMIKFVVALDNSGAVKGIEELSKKSSDLPKKFTTAGKYLTLGLTAPLTALATAGIKYNASMETYQANLTTLLNGNQKAASQLLQDLKSMANTTPFETTSLVKATQTMMSFGIQVEDSQKYLKQLGDISMGDAEKLDSLTLAFSQISSAGKLSGQDLLQMINAGFNPLNIISQKTGESMADLKDRMGEGRISVDEVTQALQWATEEGGLFYGAMDKASQTTEGKMSTLKDEFNSAVGELTTGLLPTFTKLVDKLTSMARWFGNLSPKQKDFAVKMGMILASLGPVLMLLGKIITTGEKISKIINVMKSWHLITKSQEIATKAMAVAQGILNAAMNANPIMLIVLAVGALIAILVLLWNKCEWFRDGVMSVINLIWSTIQSIGTFVINLFSNIFNFGKNLLQGYFNFWITIFSAITSFIYNNVLSPILNFFSSIFQSIWNIISNTIGKIKNGFQIMANAVKSIFTGIKNTITNLFKNVVNIVKTPINGLIELLNGAIKGLNKIKVPDWVPGVGGKGINIPLIPKLSTGTNYIAHEGLAYLHQGEAVVPKKYNPAIGGYGNNSQPNIIVIADMDVNKFGQAFVRDVKTFSGGAKNSYNYGGM